MKKPMKKRPMPSPKRMGPAKMPMEGMPTDKEVPGPAEGTSAEERYDARQAARKSRPSVI